MLLNLTILICFLIALIIISNIVIVKTLNNKNKFRLSLLFDGLINKILLLTIVIFLLIENKMIGVVAILIFFTLYIIYSIVPKNEMVEGFKDYYSNKK